MTYKIGPYYVTTVVLPLPLFVLKSSPTRHPGILVALSVTVCKEKEDYNYLSNQLKQKGKIVNLVYGTDGEQATEMGFEEVYPMNGE